MDKPSKRRCAIYTRKSTEEGLEQEFNSLDAQRESCAAFILSQAHEGWENVPEFYDDGGYSGGTMNRPALSQLMLDVKAGKVNVIVVYKVDRLTRSLADFAKIVEVLDEADASFVSVTQAFNTTSSMGRLTLNVLLSFAQFEREVTSERIRDKFAASKKKGMWMGGVIPHGYRVKERKLLIDEDEAQQVRHIFERYAELKSVPQLACELKQAGYRTRHRQLKSGRTIGKAPFGKGALACILKNPIYLGKIAHQGNIYDGEHKAIIDQTLFDKVQAVTRSNCHDTMLGKRTANPSLLTRMLKDPDGKPMSPVQARKKDRRYRYYATQTDLIEADSSAWRISAGPLEKLVLTEIANSLEHPDLREADDARVHDQLMEAQQIAERLRSSSIVAQRGILLGLNTCASISDEKLTLSYQCPITGGVRQQSADAKFVRKGKNVRILSRQSALGTSREADPGLLELIAKAFAAREHLIEESPNSLVADFSKRHQLRLARLSCLSPDIIGAILSGRQPADLTARRLLKMGTLPLSWFEQKTLLGFE